MASEQAPASACLLWRQREKARGRGRKEHEMGIALGPFRPPPSPIAQSLCSLGMPADFKPALGAVHACAIPPAAGSEAPGADDVLIITFIASKPTALGAECELWTNLPSDDPASWDGSSWREVAFVDRSTAVMAPPPEEAADWPLLSLSDAGESPPLLGPAPVRHATIRIPLGELGENRHFEYTYRLRHPDGGIEWLGDGGSNGKFEISVGNGAAAAAATGRWEAIASKAFINGASSEASKASREWSGGEGRLGVTVGPGAEWAGFGIRWTKSVTLVVASQPYIGRVLTLIFNR